MIVKADMMGLLIDACPSFRPAWEEWLAEWAESADDLPLYLALNELARHLVGLLEQCETTGFAAIFQVVERLQLEGEHYVSEAIVVGLLEDLQNLNLYTTAEPEQFRPFLGPESAEAWDRLYGFWDHVREFNAAGLLEPKSGPTPVIDPAMIEDPKLRRIVGNIYPKR